LALKFEKSGCEGQKYILTNFSEGYKKPEFYADFTTVQTNTKRGYLKHVINKKSI
jgi:hypothetical protein